MSEILLWTTMLCIQRRAARLKAIQMEPGYAEPYYGAAVFYVISAVFGVMPPRTALSEAEDLVSKGLALDEDSVGLHSTLGMLRMFQWRWNESEQAHRRAINMEGVGSVNSGHFHSVNSGKPEDLQKG